MHSARIRAAEIIQVKHIVGILRGRLSAGRFGRRAFLIGRGKCRVEIQVGKCLGQFARLIAIG
jgi:hypothetical protein